MSEKKKVLIVNDPLQYGGSDLVAVRLQQNLNKEKFECVYCLRHDEEIGPLEEQVAATGVRIIHQPEDKLSYVKSYKYYLNLFEKEHFDIVHSHLLFFSGFVLKAAKKRGIEKRVAHSHFSQPLVLTNNPIKKITAKIYRIVMRKVICRYATDIVGCSLETGQFLAGKKGFAKKGIILNNGIDTEIYNFNDEKRQEIRNSLGLNEKTVLGHIGQMYYVKNHDFLIDVFYEFQKKHEDSALLLISDGPYRKKLEEKVKRLNIAEKVKFLGFRDDISELLLAMDCFVFPSIHEGFPLTLVEAQASKLPCLISDTVNSSTKLNANVKFISLNSPINDWVCEINELLKLERDSVDNSKVITEYDIRNISKKLEKVYLD